MSREMVNSGITWIGEIPKDWNCSKTKFFTRISSGDGISNEELQDGGEYEVLGGGSGIMGYHNNYNIDGDNLIIGRVGACGYVKRTNGKRYVSDNALIMRITSNTLLFNYLYYVLTSAELSRLNTSTAQPLITATKVYNVSIPIPSLAEQQRIVEFLDRKCAEVDEMIALQEQIIEELKAYKQSVITEAVTKGLNPAATMRDSEIMFVDKIPSHWKETKTLRLLSMPITDGPHETPEGLDDGIPFISADAVSDGYINFDNKWGYISQEFYEACCKKYIPQKQDIYMIKSGASTGRTAIVETDEIFTIWSPLAVFRANQEVILPYFLLYVLRSDSYQKQVENKWSFGTQQNIGMRTLEKLIISYPPISEQQTIANYLDEKCADIDSLIQTKQSKIDSLKEYKKSIIYEYVTGKKEVE